MRSKQRSLGQISRILAGISMLAASLVLVGWATNDRLLQSFSAESVSMNPLTAGLFLVAALALGIKDSGSAHPVVGLWIRRASSCLMIASGVIVFCGFFDGSAPGIDRILFSGSLLDNRMAPNTAVYFMLFGLALVSLEVPKLAKTVSQPLAMIVLFGAAIALLGYAYGATGLYGIGNFIPMAMNTSLLFVMLSLSIIAGADRQSCLSIFYGEGTGSSMVRRLLPIAITIPCLLGFLRVLGQRAGWYDTEFGASIMVVATVALLVLAILVTAHALNNSDAQRIQGEISLKAAHTELEQQTQILQAILNSMKDGVSVVDENGRSVLFNPAAEQILRSGPHSGKVENWTDHFGCYLTDGVTPYPADKSPLIRTMNGEEVEEEEIVIRSPDRSDERWISLSGQPLVSERGERKGGVVVFRDISERKRAETALRNSHDELERRVAERTKELAETNNELTQKNQENEMFVYSVSHDLRSPLVNLQGFSKELDVAAKEIRGLLLDDQIPEDIRAKTSDLLDNDVQQAVRFIQIAVTRLGNIIEALLRLSRVGRIEYQCKPVDLQSEIGRVVESMSVVIFDAGATVNIGALPPCYGDSTALEQMFANLIGNAIKYRDPARPCIIEIGTAEDSLDSRGSYQVYYVKDNGLGIPADHQEKIFQAFKRAHPQVAQGDGIGLTVVRRTVERHGGKAWVESVMGRGSTFFVSLPVRETMRDSNASTAGNSNGGIQHGRTNGNLVSRRR